MEIRNQFIHNGDTNSFKFVIEKRVNKKKIFKDFVKNLNLESNDLEKQYQLGFNKFTASIINELTETEKRIWNDRMKQLENELELHKKTQELQDSEMLIECLSDSIDEVTAIFGKHFKEVFKDPKDIGKKLKVGIQQVFKKKLKDKMNMIN